MAHIFTKSIDIQGKHARYVNFLTSNRIFRRNIDVYMQAAVIGFVYGQREAVDTSDEYEDVEVQISLETMFRERQSLEFIYQLIMLQDRASEKTDEERMYRAFRDHTNIEEPERHDRNFKTFESYVRGGITYLYENITKDVNNIDGYIKNIDSFIKDFHEDYIEEIHLQGELDITDPVI